jgi:hypothetical protein
MSYLIEAKKKILVLLNSRKDVLCSGGAKDYPDYRRITGEISGLNHAIRELDDLQMRIEKNNGDLDEDGN